MLKNSFFQQHNVSDAFVKRELALIVAQTAWGEDIIRPLIKSLMISITNKEVKKNLNKQLDDEHRHTKLYWNHIHHLDPGVVRKLSPIYQRVCEESLASRDPFELLACILICLESFAFGAFKFRRKVCNYKPTIQLDYEVERDELEHVNIGMSALQDLLQAGLVLNRQAVVERVRRVTMAFRSGSFVEELESALGESAIHSTATSELMKDYYLTCGDEFSLRLKKFLTAARPFAVVSQTSMDSAGMANGY